MRVGTSVFCRELQEVQRVYVVLNEQCPGAQRSSAMSNTVIHCWLLTTERSV